jgi:ankyrin repeat protein
MQYLVQQGADKDKATIHGYTALYFASWHGHLEVVEYLLEQGADRDKQNCGGYTPLHEAARCGNLEVAKALMRYGANLDARNKRGRLPIDVADNEEIKQAILDEPRRRNDHTYKRIREEDLQPAKQQKVEGEGVEGTAAAEEEEEEEDESEGDDDDDEEEDAD